MFASPPDGSGNKYLRTTGALGMDRTGDAVRAGADDNDVKRAGILRAVGVIDGVGVGSGSQDFGCLH